MFHLNISSTCVFTEYTARADIKRKVRHNADISKYISKGTGNKDNLSKQIDEFLYDNNL